MASRNVTFACRGSLKRCFFISVSISDAHVRASPFVSKVLLTDLVTVHQVTTTKMDKPILVSVYQCSIFV